MTVMTLVSIGALILLLACWLLWGRDKEKLVTPTEFYPPDGLDPMQIEFIASGSVSGNSMYAMILLWVSKGYLEKIEKAGRSGVRLVRDIDESEPQHVKRLFYNIFMDRKSVWFDDMPKEWDADTTINGEIRSSLKGMKVLESRGRVFEFVSIAFAFIWLFILVWLFRMNVVIFLLLFIIGFGIWSVRGLVTYYFKMTRSWATLIFAVAGLMLGAVIIYQQCTHLNMSVVDIASLILLYFGGIFLCAIMERRMNTSLYGRVLGFREFIKTAEADKLAELSKEDPDYGEELLPYAVVFGLGTEWSDRQEMATRKN